MTEIRALFWDIGGVLLSNGWDRYARAAAEERFGLDHDDFESRHQANVDDFEMGRLTLKQYLQNTIFYTPRPFSEADFTSFMYAQSHPFPEMLGFARSLRESGRWLMSTLNNESREINDYRVDHFGLRSVFQLFLSSWTLGLRKPDPAIFEVALQLTQLEAGQAVLIDDRESNIEAARALGFHTVHNQGDPATLGVALSQLGITPD